MNIDSKQTPAKKENNLPNNKKISIFDLFGIKKETYDSEKNLIKFPIKNKVNSVKKEKEEEIEESYLKINTNNGFELHNSLECNKKLNDIINLIDEFIEDKTITENISRILLEKLFPKCQQKAFLISKLISKRFMKLKKINKIVENKINYYFDRRLNLRYSRKLILDRDNINNIGYILCYSYSKFEDLKIMNKKDITNYIKLIKKIDIINDYYRYCNENGNSPADYKIFNFLETNNNNKYLLPGVFLFLMNILEFINILEISLDEIMFNSKEDYKDDFYLFIMTLLNIHYLATSTYHFKVNFHNKKLQKDIYSYFTKKLESLYKSNNMFPKKNVKTSENENFRINWDFEKDYIIKKKNKRFSNKEEETIIDQDKLNKNINNKKLDILDDFIDINNNEELENLKKSNTSKRNGSFMIKNDNLESLSKLRSNTNDFPEIDDFIHLEAINRNYSFIEKIDKKNKQERYNKIIEKDRNIIELIYIVTLGIIHLKNLKSLDLVMNDCYSEEFIICFKQYYISSSKIPKYMNNFHMLDSFIRRMKNIKVFNIEFNSLDFISFYKILSFIKKNQNINSLQISFFSSLITYTPQYIYKLYQQRKGDFNFNMNTSEVDILNELLPFFVENLEVFFELIRTKMKQLEILSFNFDMPEIFALKKRYLNVIFKFLLNILFLIDNKNSKIKKLVIISPNTLIDSRSVIEIENMIDSINLDKNNKIIKELSIQMQFYQINNIKNIITSNLTTLKIGEVDIVTLRGLTKYICSYNFFKRSVLNILTVGILNHITQFTKEIEYLLNELFSIKIKTLKEINVYSNIFIKEQQNYYKILENNWIPSCMLTLNEKSKLSWKQKEIEEKMDQILGEQKQKTNEKNKDKKIYYLIHHELEEEILSFNEKKIRDKKRFLKTNCEVAWYLRHVLIFKYAKKEKYEINYYDQKNIIFNILKFLYFIKQVKIESEEKSNDNTND